MRTDMTPGPENISIRNKVSLRLAGSRLTGIMLLAVLSFICSGCSLADIRKQSHAMGSLRRIEGSVERATGKQGQIYVLLFRGSFRQPDWSTGLRQA